MRNESYPRRNMQRGEPRRGSQQAGRNARAKENRTFSFMALSLGWAEDIGTLNVA